MTSIESLHNRGADGEVLADNYLSGSVNPGDVGATLFVAAALQVYFTRAVAGLEASTLRCYRSVGCAPAAARHRSRAL